MHTYIHTYIQTPTCMHAYSYVFKFTTVLCFLHINTHTQIFINKHFNKQALNTFLVHTYIHVLNLYTLIHKFLLMYILIFFIYKFNKCCFNITTVNIKQSMLK